MFMSTTTAVEVVRLEDPADGTEAIALAGLLSGYCGSTRKSYATDLRVLGT